ncbi:hypothetical protein E2K93_07600 [Thalassotalea sp. HSM 43]|uniref:sulfatase family protein n=1 Tax=Thalassotalea sp. HSM 43 TaxID=2552945 RepID=UPI00108150AC|nr:sulfatase [Thalassotalea sp. HSM 43]QBY04261.1 hypothetical protein E2K93_07600 [Thalassotalea sp. HSM 43]
MNRFNLLIAKFLTVSLVLSSALSAGLVHAESTVAQSKPEKKPNILWLITEDNSKHYLKLYDDAGTSMPTVEKLASQGLTFNNAFSNAPVCSTARTTLATGIYGPKLGTLHHRGYQEVSLPQGFKTFNELLRDAGYYTTNRAKTDYNFIAQDKLWDESSKTASWRNRQPEQSFFHVQTFGITHEGKLHFNKGQVQNRKTKHDPKQVRLAPIYPDTELFRYTMARTLDNHKTADAQMGAVIKQLEQDGELENTFIFYFGDHGGVLPGSKGYLFDRGLHVPLVVRVPENFKYLVGKGLASENTRVDGFVSFIDFAPTMLSLAGLDAEKQMDGQSFLAKDLSLQQLNKRNNTFSHADRFDEKSDLVRSIRIGKYKYIRHYQPYYSDSLYAYYRYRQHAFKQWKQLYREGKLNAAQSAFFELSGTESLYDIEADPYETNNLATDEAYQNTLLAMRTKLRHRLINLPDLGFLPESMWLAQSKGKAFEWGQAQQPNIEQLIAIADLQLQPYKDVQAKLVNYLNTGTDAQKIWSLISLSSFGSQASEQTTLVQHVLTNSSHVLIKARAIEFLTLQQQVDSVSELTKLISHEPNPLVQVELLNIAAFVFEQTGETFTVPTSMTLKPPVRGSDSFKIDSWIYERWLYISGKIKV